MKYFWNILLVVNVNVSVDFIGKNKIKDIFEIIVNYNIIIVNEKVPRKISDKIDLIWYE